MQRFLQGSSSSSTSLVLLLLLHLACLLQPSLHCCVLLHLAFWLLS
jgi:hypothetical protein